MNVSFRSLFKLFVFAVIRYKWSKAFIFISTAFRLISGDTNTNLGGVCVQRIPVHVTFNPFQLTRAGKK